MAEKPVKPFEGPISIYFSAVPLGAQAGERAGALPRKRAVDVLPALA